MSDWGYIIWAYALTWFTVLGYLGYVIRRLHRAAAVYADLIADEHGETNP